MKWKSRPATAKHGEIYKSERFAWRPVQCADRKVWFERYMSVEVFNSVSGLVTMLTGIETGWANHGCYARGTADYDKWKAETRTAMGDIQNTACECAECKVKAAKESQEGNLIRFDGKKPSEEVKQ